MGTVNTSLLFAKPNSTWVKATLSWATLVLADWPAQPSAATERFVDAFRAACGEFSASREVLIPT